MITRTRSVAYAPGILRIVPTIMTLALSVVSYGFAAGWQGTEKEGLVVLLVFLCAISLLPLMKPRSIGCVISALVAAFFYLGLSLGPRNDTPDLPYLPTNIVMNALFNRAYDGQRLTSLSAQERLCTCTECIDDTRSLHRSKYFRAGHVFFSLAATLLGALCWRIWELSRPRLVAMARGRVARAERIRDAPE